MGGVSTLERLAKAEALNGLGQNDRRLPLVLDGRFVGRIDLAVIVATALEAPDLVVGHALDQLGGSRVATKEVFTNESAVFGLVGLVVAIWRLVH